MLDIDKSLDRALQWYRDETGKEPDEHFVSIWEWMVAKVKEVYQIGYNRAVDGKRCVDVDFHREALERFFEGNPKWHGVIPEMAEFFNEYFLMGYRDGLAPEYDLIDPDITPLHDQ